MRAALQQHSRLALVYSHLKLPPQRKPTSPTSAVFSKSETTCIFHFDSQRVAEMEVIHKSEFGVSEQSSFVEIILILVNGHPRGGVSAFFREISAFF